MDELTQYLKLNKYRESELEQILDKKIIITKNHIKNINCNVVILLFIKKIINAVTMKILSINGSRLAPNFVVFLFLLAKYPSKISEIITKAKIINNKTLLFIKRIKNIVKGILDKDTLSAKLKFILLHDLIYSL